MRPTDQFEAYKLEIERLNRLYDALRQVNQAIVRLRTSDELFNEVCRIAVEFGGFELAWIGWIDAETQRIVPVAQYGKHGSFLADIPIYADERPEGRGPTGVAIRSGKPYICNDYFNDPNTLLWRGAAQEHGFHSSGSFLIRVDNKVAGILGIYASEPGYFQSKEITLLEEAARDVSFALETFAHEEERLKAQQAAGQLAAIVETSNDAIVSKLLDGTITSWNPAAERMFGYSAKEICGRNISILIPPDRREEESKFLHRIGAGERITDFETERVRKSGQQFPVSVTISPLRSPGGEVIGASKIVRDITERKKAVEALAAEAARIRLLFDQASDAMYLLDDERNVVEANASFGALLGRPIAEVLTLHPWDWDVISTTREQLLSRFPSTWTHPLTFESRIRRKDGSIADVEVAITPTEWNGQHLYFHVMRDITARKRAEEALSESQARFVVVAENLSEGLNTADPDSRMLTWNAAALQMYGFSSAEEAIMPFSDYSKVLEFYSLDGALLPRTKWPMTRVFGGEVLRDLELRVCRVGSDMERVFSYSGSIVEYGNRKKLAFLTTRDLTDHKRAEAALREVQAQLEVVVQSLDEGLLITDLAGNLLMSNPAAFSLAGITDQVKGNRQVPTFPRVLEISTMDGEVLTFDQWPLGRIMHGEILNNYEAQVRRYDSTEKRIFSYSGSIVEYEGGRKLAFLKYQDITDRKRAEEALRASQARFEVVVDSLNEGLIIADMEGNLLTLNPVAAKALGLSSAEARKYRASDFSRMIQISTMEGADLPFEQWPMTRIMRGEVLRDCEVRVRRVGSSESWVYNYSGATVPYEGGKKLVFVKFQDITDRKRAEESLRETQAQLLQSQKMEAIGLLAGGVAHDFNNALGVVLGYGELLEERLASDEVGLRFVKQILLAEARAASLTRQLLAFSRKQILQPVTLSLNTVVSGMEEMLHRLIGADITLTLLCDPNLQNIKADPGHLEQILMNMVVNARDAMPQGGTLTIRTANAEIGPAEIANDPHLKEGKFVMLSVADTGCGMDKATQDRIFEPFFTTKEPGKGTGLGLSTSYGIVQQSGGYISLHSEIGVGTSFIIYFPPVEEPAQTANSTSLSQAQGRGSESILVVDDEEPMRNLLCSALRAKGYNVLDAANSTAAISIVRRNHPPIDLLVSDVIMPGLTGPELVEQLLTTHPRLKVIFISGYIDDYLSRYGNFGSETVLLQKPFSPDVLIKMVREILGREANNQ